MNKLGMTESDLTYRKVMIHLEDERSMLEKVSKTGLNLDKFVFIAPEAQSCKLYDEDFWCELINQFQAKGYDVFVNLVEDDVKLKSAIDYKTCDLNFAEAFALARRSKKIVSLRSGLQNFYYKQVFQLTFCTLNSDIDISLMTWIFITLCPDSTNSTAIC